MAVAAPSRAAIILESIVQHTLRRVHGVQRVHVLGALRTYKERQLPVLPPQAACQPRRGQGADPGWMSQPVRGCRRQERARRPQARLSMPRRACSRSCDRVTRHRRCGTCATRNRRAVLGAHVTSREYSRALQCPGSGIFKPPDLKTRESRTEYLLRMFGDLSAKNTSSLESMVEQACIKL